MRNADNDFHGILASTGTLEVGKRANVIIVSGDPTRDIDALDPLEPPPYGDNDLAEAQRRVGKRMLLCGNIPSQAFALDSFTVGDVRGLVRQAIEEGAPGGGFTLRTTGSAHVGNGKTREQKIKSIECGLAMIEAWREFGA